MTSLPNHFTGPVGVGPDFHGRPPKRQRRVASKEGPAPKYRLLPEEMLERLRLEDGVIIWAKGRIPGKPVYSQSRTRSGLTHKTVEFNRIMYAYHRVVWFLHHREQPLFIIDHIDRDGTNNHPSNLRRATTSQNQANRKGSSRRGLPKGVSISRQGFFTAMISAGGGKRRYLGRFKTAEEANAAYLAAAKDQFGEFARGGE